MFFEKSWIMGSFCSLNFQALKGLNHEG